MRTFRSSLLLLSLFLLAASALAQPQQPQRVPRQLVGAWHYSHDEEHGRHVIIAALEPTVARLPDMVQPMARERIAERTHIARTIDVTVQGDHVRVVYHGEHDMNVDTPLGGTATVTNAEGQEVQVTQRLTGGWLEQIFRRDENGAMRQLLSTEGDGRTMHLDTTIEGQRLDQPIRWRLDYVRSTPAPPAH